MPRGKRPKLKIELKYSLLNEIFTSTIGKRLTKNLQNAISRWIADKNDQNAKELIDLYVKSLSAYWKKTKLKDMHEVRINKDITLIVDLVYKKGRKPNSIRLENNPLLKDELLKLHLVR